MNHELSSKLSELIMSSAKENRIDILDQLLMVLENVDPENQLLHYPELLGMPSHESW